jgi:excisionase family DNA binding protein
MKNSPALPPYWLTLQQAAAYLNLNRNVFDSLVRPHLTEIPVGERVRFDRAELERWADGYVAKFGRVPGKE